MTAFLVLGFLVLAGCVKAQELCNRQIEACVCDLGDSRTIDLRSIGVAANKPWFKDVESSNKPALFFYSYNPCYPFTDCNGIAGLAMSQWPSDSADACFGIGVFNSSEFVGDEDGNVSIHYHSYDFERTAVVHLECDTEANKTSLIQYGDDYYKYNFTFRLRGPDVCPLFTPKSISTGAIALISVTAGIVAVIVVLGILYNYYRRRHVAGSNVQYRLAGMEPGGSNRRPRTTKIQRGDVLDDVNTSIASRTSYGSTEEASYDLQYLDLDET